MISESVEQDKKKEFRTLFDSYWEALYSYAFKILEDHSDAQDIIQDVFLRLWKKRDVLSSVNSIEAYLFQSVKYGIYSLIRSQERRSHYYSQIAEATETDADVEKYLDGQQLRIFLQQRVERLPEKMQQIVRLHLHDCLNVTEIAHRLSLSEQTVRNQLSNAVKKLSRDMSGQEELMASYCLCVLIILSYC